ncbi:unnamed protein product [Leuciscus chuanchicus]
MDEMGDRAKRNWRKYWREAQKRSREKRSNEDAVLKAHTPPDSPQDQDIQEYNARHNSQSLRQERERSKTRKRHSREIKTLKEKLKKVTKQRNKMRKKIYRRRNATNKTPLDSPGTETKKMLSGSNIRNPKIKKALLFHNILRRELKKNKQTPGPRRQEPALSVSSGKILKKYRLLHQIHQFGITYKLMRGKKQTKKKPTFLKGITESVKDFFLNSARVTTDKTDTITRNKIKQQRMILADSMINLHSDFLIRNPTVKLSYSSFCALKPFYITAPKASDRKTCLCQKHENAYLMLEVLRTSGVVKSNKLDDSFQLVCCSPASEACLLRTCSRCLNKGTVTTQEQDKIHVQWKQWERVQEETVNGIHTKLVQHSVPSTRRIHQVIPHENRIQHRQLSCFCSKILVCQCFSPATFYFHGYPEEQQSDTRRAGKKRPLAMLLEEMEKEMGGEEEDMEIEEIKWRRTKTIAVDTEHQDVKVEFLHPHGPTAKCQPKLLTKDVCFCPVEDIIVKLMGNASPVKLRKQEIYSIAPDVMDFIEREHVRRLLLKA